MSTVRFGVIGLGNIGKRHASCLAQGQVEQACLSAVCTSSLEKAARFPGARAFADPAEMMRSGCIDAVIIATPHYQHVPLGIEAFNHGLHVMVEKPIAAHKADAERLIAASVAHPRSVFAAMFQFRVEPSYIQIRRMLQEGQLGKLMRATWIMTDWYRTEAYYSSGGWRATWKGEGGGVLLNQCLHNLDTLQWITGMPAQVRGFCKLGQHHDIEVEDEATAYMEYADGATGTLITSTAESPGSNRLELAGSRGKLVLENDRLLFTRNEADCLEFSKKAELGFGRPENVMEDIPLGKAKEGHVLLTRNFVRNIQGLEPLIAPGAEGLHSLELANAILYSSLIGETITLPLSGEAYEQKLRRLIASSTREKRVVKTTEEDISSSFRR